MGKVYDGIDERLTEWIRAQHLFFVASAPLSGEGHVNLSPRGLLDLAILGPREVAWLDLVGSGAETIAHVRENGRVTLMFCAFEGPPRIVRLHGRGHVLEPDDAGWPDLAARFPEHPAARAIVVVQVTRVSDSCGYGVPLMRYEADRDQLGRWAEQRGAEGLRRYQLERNAKSLDGLPALRGTSLQRGGQG